MPTFVIYVRRTPEVLGRIVSLFHRRATEIERLTAERLNDSNALRLTIEVETDPERTQLIEANLYKLIDVLSVEKSHRDRETADPATEDGNRES
jgi:acetolactate synthase-1/3 small subunit